MFKQNRPEACIQAFGAQQHDEKQVNKHREHSTKIALKLAYNHLVAKARKARLTSMRNENSKLTDVQIQQIFKNRLEAICKKRKVLGLLLNTKNNHPQQNHLLENKLNTQNFSFLNLRQDLKSVKSPSFLHVKLQFDACKIWRKLFFKF